jgi:tight adherence protein C
MTARLLLPVVWMVFVVALAAVVRAPRPDAMTTLEPRPAEPRRHRIRFVSRRRRNDDIADAVPDVVDLFAVATAAGLNPRLAVAAVAERAPPGPLTDALADVCRRVRAGDRLADALDVARDELDSDAVRPLVGALTDAERYGSALGPTLERLADDARRSRQRRAEEAARKLPVKLLFPLVVCILPAFGLLTVAPLIAGGLRALRL